MRTTTILMLGGLGLLAACGDATFTMEYGSMAPPQGDVDMDDNGVVDEDGVRHNPWVDASEEDTSTFGADVDSGSYSLARRDLMNGQRPDPGSVRVEEFVNYFDYDLPRPLPTTLPFQVTLDAAPSAFPPAEYDNVHLLQIGVQAAVVPEKLRDPVNLVFLLDVSGSMNNPSKLGLVKYAMKQLVDKLGPRDTLGIVVYAGADGVVLPPTPVEEKSTILAALDDLSPGGSTNGEAGIRTAYELAESVYRDDGVNRVVLCTDGDFNVGMTGDDLIEEVSSWRDRGIFLTSLGFGSSFTQDDFMEQLANQSNGNYGFIDSRGEATRMLGDKLVDTLQVVAKDVKIQVEFDTDAVQRWRLIGYENRVLDNDDFDNDKVDSGDIGAGHSVVGLYEVVLDEAGADGPLAEVRLRYKEPDGDESSEHIWSIDMADRATSFDAASADLRMAAGVTEFAEILRDSPHVDEPDLDAVKAVVQQARPAETRDPSEVELLELIDRADTLAR